MGNTFEGTRPEYVREGIMILVKMTPPANPSTRTWRVRTRCGSKQEKGARAKQAAKVVTNDVYYCTVSLNLHCSGINIQARISRFALGMLMAEEIRPLNFSFSSPSHIRGYGRPPAPSPTTPNAPQTGNPRAKGKA